MSKVRLHSLRFPPSSYKSSPLSGLVNYSRIKRYGKFLPLYMLQPKGADIRREPCRMPVGPNRAPGLAVTAFSVLGNSPNRVPMPCFPRSRYMYMEIFRVASLIPYQKCKLVGNTDCVEWCAHNGNIICVHINGFKAIDVRQICESHEPRKVATGRDVNAIVIRHWVLRSFNAGYWREDDVKSVCEEQHEQKHCVQNCVIEHSSDEEIVSF